MMAVQQDTKTAQDQEPGKKPTVLRVRVIDHSKAEHPAVNITMPLGVVKFGMKMAQRFSPKMQDVDVDWESVSAMIEQGQVGKLVDVEDEAEHKTVEVWVE